MVREAMQALRSELPLAKKLRGWLDGAASVEPIGRDQLRQITRELLEQAHGSEQDGSISRVPPHAGGWIMGPNDLDELTMSALTGLALALERFVLLWSLGTEVTVVGQVEGT